MTHDDEPSELAGPAAQLRLRRILGETVRNLRVTQGFSQARLARLMSMEGFEMHQTTVAKLESGGRPTPVDELVALAGLLQVTPADLVQPLMQNELPDEVQAAYREVFEMDATVRSIDDQIFRTQMRRFQYIDLRAKAVEKYQEARLAAGLERDEEIKFDV